MKENEGKNKYFYAKIHKNKKKLSIIYTEFIKYFYDFILYKIPRYIKFVQRITPKWYKMHKFFYFFAHIFVFIPPVLVAGSFFIDVVILKSFTLFPKTIFVLLLPLLLKAISYSIKEMCETDLGTVQRNIFFDPHAPNGAKYYIREELWHIKPELADILHTNLNYFLSEYDKNLKHQEYSECFEKYINEKYPKFYYQIVTCTLWIISWVYMVIYLLQKF